MTHIFRQRGIVTSNFHGKREVQDKVRETLKLARSLYPSFNLLDQEIPVVFFAKGQTAGWAKWENIERGSDIFIYNLEFNVSAIREDLEHMVNENVPHEIAHIVAHYVYRERGHGRGWKQIARSLGCKGNRCHSIKLEKARKTRKYIYKASCGTQIDVGSKIHGNIQRGKLYTVRKTKGVIVKEGFTGRVIRV